MKIAIDANTLAYKPAGITKTLLYLMDNVAELVACFTGVCFFSKRRPPVNDFAFATEKIKYWRHLPFSIGERLLYRKIADCDFIHYHANGDVLPFAPKEKNVLVLHDVLPLAIPGYFKNEKRRAKYMRNTQQSLDHAGIVFTPSEYSRKEIEKFFRVTCPLIVLPFAAAIETPEGWQLPPVAGDRPYYIYAGGYDRRKGMDKILQSFMTSPERRKLYFVGEQHDFSYEFRLLANKAKDMGILEEKGYVGQMELVRLIKGARALLYPSKLEGFGLPPLEAMKLGTPVFATKGTSVPEVCGDACIYFEPDDETDLIVKIREFERGGEALRQELINRGYAQSAMFSWPKAAQKYLAALRELCGAKGKMAT
ncbi:MAG: glycosyltransferase family 4 protein [Acidaminococcales bacterium]|jgi:glycosyltransferase involved in cell wall biosynthesis|nr:glycosyltransferase family 4 protein [Acidaminococcales bacterium]